MDAPILWQFTSSHYNEKARWALDFKRVRHIRHSLVPGFHIPTLRRVSGQSLVPVLKLDGEIISDSTKIIAALEQRFPDPPLYPSDPDARRRALELEDYFDEELGPYLRRWIFHLVLPYPEFVRAAFVDHASMPVRLAHRVITPLLVPLMKRRMNITPAAAEIARVKTVAAMDRLVRELQPSGCLVGDRFTVADLTAAALLSPLIMPLEFPYRSAVDKIPQPFANARAALERHRAFQWTLDIYRRHRGKSAAITAANGSRESNVRLGTAVEG
jgi:glutathione S-transferase